MASTEIEVIGQVQGLLVLCEEHGTTTHVSLSSNNNTRFNIPIQDTAHDEKWWNRHIGRKIKITKSITVELVTPKALSSDPRIGKYLIQVTKPLPYARALNHALSTKNCKLWKATSDKYIAIRRVEPHDNLDAIGLADGDWQNELIDVAH